MYLQIITDEAHSTSSEMIAIIAAITIQHAPTVISRLKDLSV